MPRVIKKTVQTKITKTANSIVEETTTKVEVSGDELEPNAIEKHTFFLDDEEEAENWFQKTGDDEDDSVDIYILDDDKSW